MQKNAKVITLRDANYQLYRSGHRRGQADACRDIASNLHRFANEYRQHEAINPGAGYKQFADFMAGIAVQLDKQAQHAQSEADKYLDIGLHFVERDSNAVDLARRKMSGKPKGRIARVMRSVWGWLGWHLSPAE